MLTPAAFGVIWPTFAMVALIFIVWAVMVVSRLGHIKRNPPSTADLADSEAAMRYFRPVEMPASNFGNLFEMPVLFFVVVLLMLIVHQASYPQVVLAWAYVAVRALHSVIHIGPKNVTARFLAYLVSCVILAAIWIGLFVDTLHAASVLARVG